MVNDVVIQGCEGACIGDCNVTCGQTSVVFRTGPPELNVYTRVMAPSGKDCIVPSGMISLIALKDTRHIMQYTHSCSLDEMHPRHWQLPPVVYWLRGSTITASENRKVWSAATRSNEKRYEIRSACRAISLNAHPTSSRNFRSFDFQFCSRV